MEPMDPWNPTIPQFQTPAWLSAEAPVQAVKELGGSPLGAGLVRWELNDISCS